MLYSYCFVFFQLRIRKVDEPFKINSDFYLDIRFNTYLQRRNSIPLPKQPYCNNFHQDEASSHTSKSSALILEKKKEMEQGTKWFSLTPELQTVES